MKTKFIILAPLLLAIGCGNAEFSEFDSKPMPPPEELVATAMELMASGAETCKEQRMSLVKDNCGRVKEVVGHLKKIAKKSTKVDITPMVTHYAQVNNDMIKDMIAIITSDGFKVVLIQVADLLTSIANDTDIIAPMEKLHKGFSEQPGDRLAEIISNVATNTTYQQAVFGAMHTALCENATEQDILGALFSPSVIWELGPNAGYLLTSKFADNYLKLQGKLKGLTIPKETQDFIGLIQQMIPNQDLTTQICDMQVANFQKHFALVASLLKAPANSAHPRPLRTLLNMLFKVYTMTELDGCVGKSFDTFGSEDIKKTLELMSAFIKNEDTGLMGFLKNLKPRN
ncbi:MAG: hypothetical protein V4534_07675 [Myxococcota bacterium]